MQEEEQVGEGAGKAVTAHSALAAGGLAKCSRRLPVKSKQT